MSRNVDQAASIFVPIALLLGGFFTLSKLTSSASAFRVSADTQNQNNLQATSGSTKMNSSLDKLSGKPIPTELIASRLRPDDISHSINNYEGLTGKSLVNASHENVGTNAKLNQSGLSRVSVSDVHNNPKGASKVLPSVVDPSSSFLQSELSVFHPYPSYDIRGDPPIKTGGPCPMEAPLPGQGPWQPEMEPIRSGNHYPIKIENMASKDFFT